MTSPSGVLVVDKPAGPTSHDVVARARRALGERRIGHTGTLDPFATGVLPLVVGKATRLARFLSGREKTYEAVVRLGLDTDSHDLTGLATGGARAHDPGAPLPSLAALEGALEEARRQRSQRPPAFSAKKVGGVRSHALARQRRRHLGQPVGLDGRGEDADAATPGETSLAPSPVEVHALVLETFDGERATLRLRVSAGYYVRALAYDLGQWLGCGAHLVALRRTASGEFDARDAVPLDTVEREGPAAWSRVVPMERLLPECPAVRLTTAGLARVTHGNPVDRSHCEHDGRADAAAGARWPAVRLFSPDGRLVALAGEETSRAPHEAATRWPLHPAIVLT